MARMHATGISPEIFEQVKRRRAGDPHVYNRIDCARAALIVIDMQNMFMKEGQPSWCPYGEAIVPNVNRLAGSMRERGAAIVWVRMVSSPERRESWSEYYDFYGPGRRETNAAATAEGSFGAALWPDLDVRPQDDILVKSRYSALIPGSSDLDARMKARGIDTLVITGVATNICCESTARDAHMMNYKTIVVSDGCATRTDALHTAALNVLFLTFADVMTTGEVMERLVGAPAAQPAMAR